jgi:hypothetical protein
MKKNSMIFIWKDLSTWDSFVREMMPLGTAEQIIVEIQKRQFLFKYIDDPGPFEDVYSQFSDFSSLKERFVLDFTTHFQFVRMFHCCRPLQVESYYTDGIHVLTSSEAERSFKARFLNNPKFPNISEIHIDSAIERMADSYTRFGQVYFGLDDRFLIEHCGHYLIYGSEYIQCLANFLGREFSYDLDSELKQTGKPTVFEVNIPVSQFAIEELRALSDDALPAWAHCMAHSRNQSGQRDFAITMDHTLPPRNIVDHYHPEEVPDPSRRPYIYRYKTEMTA